MKKIAICISGHMRSFERGYSSIKNSIIEPNRDFDFYFFIDTWERLDWRTEGKFQSTLSKKEEIDRLYKPENIFIENEREWDTEKYMKYVSDITCLKKGYKGVRSRGEHIPSMFYKIKSCNDMKLEYENRNNLKFDLVMRHRSDIGIDGKIDLSKVLKFSEDHIFVPLGNNLPKFPCNKKSHTRDMFAISSSRNIDYYSEVYQNLESICEQTGEFRPEVILHQHLQNNDKIKIIEVEYSWDVIE